VTAPDAPESDQQVICSRCHKTCQPHEGAVVVPLLLAGPLSMSLRKLLGDKGWGGWLKFMCSDCLKVRRITITCIIGIALLAMAVYFSVLVKKFTQF